MTIELVFAILAFVLSYIGIFAAMVKYESVNLVSLFIVLTVLTGACMVTIYENNQPPKIMSNGIVIAKTDTWTNTDFVPKVQIAFDNGGSAWFEFDGFKTPPNLNIGDVIHFTYRQSDPPVITEYTIVGGVG